MKNKQFVKFFELLEKLRKCGMIKCEFILLLKSRGENRVYDTVI